MTKPNPKAHPIMGGGYAPVQCPKCRQFYAYGLKHRCPLENAKPLYEAPLKLPPREYQKKMRSRSVPKRQFGRQVT